MSVNATTARSEDVQDRVTVPWSTVLPLAAVMAYADGFWLMSLRGAVGSIERTDAPFASWVRESTLALPVFVVAVLGALLLAARWSGPVPAPRPTRIVAATALLVVAAGTLVGITELAASTVYDYHLQTGQLALMGSMGTTSAAATSPGEASLRLLIRAVGYGSAILLVTNLVLVSWVVALRGGRLDLSTHHRPATLPTQPGPTRMRQAKWLLAAGLLGSAVIHAAVVPEHQSEWPAASTFFIVLVVAEVAVAGLLLTQKHTAVLYTAAAVSLGPLALWLYSRTAGIPFGPEPGTPESIGLADTAACALELTTLIVAVTLLQGKRWLQQRTPVSTHIGWLILLTVIATTTTGLAGSNLTWLNISSDQPATTSTH